MEEALSVGARVPREGQEGRGPEHLNAFQGVQQEVDHYARFLEPLVTSLPSVVDRAVAAQWALVLTGSAPRAGVHEEYLKQLLVCCTLGRLLGVFAEPPASAALQPLPDGHSVEWLLRSARAQEQQQRADAGHAGQRQESEVQGGEDAAVAAAPSEANEDQQKADSKSTEAEPSGVSKPAVDGPAVQVQVSAGGTQYLAVQDLSNASNAESHFYLAFSTESVSNWIGAADVAQGGPPSSSQPSAQTPQGPKSPSVPWLSSHEDEGLDWLVDNPGFLTLPSSERPDSALWQEASLGDDFFKDFQGTSVADLALQAQQAPAAPLRPTTVWVEDEWGDLMEVPAEAMAVAGEDWRPAEFAAAAAPPTGHAGRRAPTARSQVRLRISTPSREDVVVPGESSPRSPRTPRSRHPPLGRPGPAAAAMRRVRVDATSLDESEAFRPPVASSFAQPAGGYGYGGPAWRRAAYGGPAATPLAGVDGWGASSYEDDGSWGWGSSRSGPAPGARYSRGGRPWRDSLGETYGSAEATESLGTDPSLEANSLADSLGARGWPYRYSLSRSSSAPAATSASEDESALNQTVYDTSAQSAGSDYHASAVADGVAPAGPRPSPATPASRRGQPPTRTTRRRLGPHPGYPYPGMQGADEGSLFKPASLTRFTPSQPVHHVHRALSDSNMYQRTGTPDAPVDETSWSSSPGQLWGSIGSPGLRGSPMSPRGVATSTPRSKGPSAAAADLRRRLYSSDNEYDDTVDDDGSRVGWDASSWPSPPQRSPRNQLALVPCYAASLGSDSSRGGSPGARALAARVRPRHGHGLPGASAQSAPPAAGVLLAVPTAPTSPGAAHHGPQWAQQQPGARRRATWTSSVPAGPPPSPATHSFVGQFRRPSRCATLQHPPRYDPAAGATLSATLYPTSTVAAATYRGAPSPSGQPHATRQGWFRVHESGRPEVVDGEGLRLRPPAEASLASTPWPRPRRNPRARPAPRVGAVPRRLSFSESNSSSEPQVEFPPSSPGSSYDTSYHTAPSTPYSEYHSFH